MKRLFNISLFVLAALSVISCSDERGPNYQYFPNMYEPVGYEAYGSYEVFENTQEAKLPVEGTIPRGWKPYEYEDTNEGYQNAKANLKNPIPYTEDNVNKGKELYTIYCAVCHGDKGDGKGILFERKKILGIPAYNDQGRAITEGSVYHVMYYGINTMGSYASQTDEKERWQINHYVMDLKRQLNGQPKREFVKESDMPSLKEQMVEAHNEPAEPYGDVNKVDDEENQELSAEGDDPALQTN